MRLFRDHWQRFGRLLFVVPGGSASHALECLAFGHVATVNRSALTVPGPIDLACCNDLEALNAIRPAWDRVRSFLVPDQLGVGGEVVNHSWASEPGVPHDRALIFPHRPLTASPEEVDAALADPDRLATCNSACAGLHAAGRLGYRQIWVLGCDGGRSYDSLLCGGPVDRDFGVIRERMEQIARGIEAMLDCVVKFWPDRF